MFWVHDTIKLRQHLGEYHRLIAELRLDADRFHRYFRMSVSQFDTLLEKIQNSVARQDTNFRNRISSAERLAVTLR
jgi:hypothetical protein